MPEPVGMLQGEGHDGQGLGGAGLRHRAPVRLPCLRCTVCLVTPSRVAMSCQDHPSVRGVLDLEDLQPLDIGWLGAKVSGSTSASGWYGISKCPNACQFFRLALATGYLGAAGR